MVILGWWVFLMSEVLLHLCSKGTCRGNLPIKNVNSPPQVPTSHFRALPAPFLAPLPAPL